MAAGGVFTSTKLPREYTRTDAIARGTSIVVLLKVHK